MLEKVRTFFARVGFATNKRRSVNRGLSPIVFANHAEEFLFAAQREAKASTPSFSMPAYFLVARSIELGLKAFLLTQGRDEKALRKVGHDLKRAFRKAVAAGLRNMTAITKDEEHCLRWINEYYWRKDLEYPTTGYKSYPPLTVLTGLAERLLNDLKPKTRAWGLARAKQSPFAQPKP